ncbi:hypothetical protein L3556_06055 [Candidatus Synechococcus calcipolaris G9]|uniref:Uncharacterized protein n=1 Tax=Candidatus Synechococcus calcipolaris G9 TaxID=1497997 RepID=A0ABT6EYY2_9SYNE|nr:hypothetical protein [Candidatus Synechococcus calcipolaris]MDG2990498.1 hypothetical protein [Candidatus Synechococcus calcipolaris G9]
MKRKGSIGGNPNPVQTPEFLAKQFPPAPDIPPGVKLGEPICVAVPLPIDAEIRRLKNRSIWLRRIITEAARRDLMSPSPEESGAIAHQGTSTPSPAVDVSPSAEMAEQPTKRKRGRPRKVEP